MAEVSLIGRGDENMGKTLAESDVVLFGRAVAPQVLDMVRRVQAAGKPVIVDFDDNMFDVSPMSPHYAHLGIMPMTMDTPDGRAVPMWEDGKGGFSVSTNRALRKHFGEILRAVNCVTVTTPPLATHYERFNDCVRIIPNSVDFRIWRRLPLTWDGGKVRLLYTGAANHQEDCLFVFPVLEALQRKYPELQIVLVGSDWSHVQSNLDRSRVEVHEWVDIEAYPYLLRSLGCHIGIAPISKTSFNDCRSSLKWMEYSALGMATVATRWGSYRRDLRHGETALLADSRDEWQEALSGLIANANLRARLAQNAYREIRLRHSMDFAVEGWMNVFREVLGDDDSGSQAIQHGNS